MNIKQEFIKQFCNDHNGYVRWLRGVAFTKKDFLEDILNFCNRQDKQINKDKIRMLKRICKHHCFHYREICNDKNCQVTNEKG